MAKNPRAQDPNLLPEIVFVQSSQWLPGTPAKLEEGSDFVYAQHPSIVAFTEIFSSARAKTLEEEGYTVHHEPHTDSAVAWDSAVWTVLHAETVQVTDKHYWTKEGQPTKPQKVVFVILENVLSGHRVLVEATHFPPRTEGGGGPGGIWRPEMIRRWQVTIDALSGIRKERKRLKSLFDYDAEILTADWNLDIMRTAIRAWFKTQFPSLTPNFPTTYKGFGSLGKKGGRMIDWSLLAGLSVLAEPLVFKVVSSDHKSVSTRLKFKRPARTVVPPVTPTPLKSVDVVAQEVVDGLWGNGDDRRTRLTSAGYDYDAVQAKVAELLAPVAVEHDCPACGNRHSGVIPTPSR